MRTQLTYKQITATPPYNPHKKKPGRLILGLGVGFATQATPLYLSEMAPYNLRGALNVMFQLAVTIGILAAQLINYGLQYVQPWGWRVALAMGAVPALVVLVGSLMLPETPNSLIQRGRYDQGRKVLQRIRGVDDVDLEYDDITDASEEAAKMKSAMRLIVGRGYRPQLAIAVLVPIFQQFTGINAIMFYAPQLVSQPAGLAAREQESGRKKMGEERPQSGGGVAWSVFLPLRRREATTTRPGRRLGWQSLSHH
jgi:MFS family permease